MPYIKASTNISINDDKKEIIKSKFGDAIKIMGKTEDWLMIELSDNNKMYFKGKCDDGMCFIDVKVLGSVNNSNEMTKVLTEIINSELGILPNNIYIAYQGYSDWGYNGNNF